jgi:hypothetical protein
MNAPTPSTAADPHEEALAELERLAWAVQMHAEGVQRYAALGCLEMLDLALRHTGQCLRGAYVVREGLRNVR